MALKKLVAEPIQAIAEVAKDMTGGWTTAVISTEEGITISKAFEYAVQIREDRDATQEAHALAAKAAKDSIKRDRAARIVQQSKRLTDAADFGSGAHMHKEAKPLKTKYAGAKLMLQDGAGNVTIDKQTEGRAVKEYMTVRARGRLMNFTELIMEVRGRSRQVFEGELDPQAVVGNLDFRKRSSTCNAGKSHGPSKNVSDLFRAEAEQMARLNDPMAIEATLAVDVSLTWQGNDNAMLVKNQIGNVQALDNQRSIALADQEPKIVGGELRTRTMPHLADSIVTTQWGDGFGAASCEIAHSALEGFAAYAQVLGVCVVRIFVDVVQASPSLVVALDLPLPLRTEAIKTLLREAGFSDDDVLEIIAESVSTDEWGNTSAHLRQVVAGFQEDQWAAVDYSGGVMASTVGAAVGLPLAGIVAVIVLSRIARRIQRRLHEAGLVAAIESEEASTCMDPYGSMQWADAFKFTNFGIADDDVFVHATTADKMMEDTQAIVAEVFLQYTRAGLEVHLQKKKTCTVFTNVGKRQGGVGQRHRSTSQE